MKKYKEIRYDEVGNPICEICELSFNKVLAHVNQMHQITAEEYKIAFGFNKRKGIVSLSSKEKARTNALNNYDKCISGNLLKNGANSRFGANGRA